ncbi:MAG: hypothetical protein D6702_04645 [Planctomycetota bacterium]|nr:MAG: hypothetical protein D6702_04645 [Planctomycetota bacterium]
MAESCRLGRRFSEMASRSSFRSLPVDPWPWVDRLEPGLRPGPPPPVPEAVGAVDALGGRVWIFALGGPPARAVDELLDLVERSERDASAPARLLVLLPAEEEELVRRLGRIRPALRLRLYALPSGEGVPAILEEPAPPGGDRRQILEEAGLEDEALRHGRRFLAAAERLDPPVRLEGGAWPLLLRTLDGTRLALHRGPRSLVLVEAVDRAEPLRIELADDRGTDLAIDRLLRRQYPVRRSQPEEA